MTYLRLLRALTAVLVLIFSVMFTASTVMAAESTDNPDADDGNTSYGYLADILEDEAARERLINELRALASGESPTNVEGSVSADQPAVQADERISPARRIADTSRDFAESFVNEISNGVAAVGAVFSGRQALNMDETLSAAINLLIVIAVTVGLLLVLRLLVRPLFASASRWALQDTGRSAMLRKLVAVTGSAVLDVGVTVLAFVGGYLVALFALGISGEMDIYQSLFLNAFLLIEIFKVIIRGLFASRDDGLRMLPMSAEQAAYWNAWLARLSGFIGYGILFIVPLVNGTLSPEVGRLVAMIVMLLAFLYALAIILQNKASVSQQIEARASQAELAFNRLLLDILAKSWYVVAIVYFATLALVTVTRPEDALPFMLAASLQTLLAIGIGLFISVVLSQLISRGFHVPEETRARFPMLENRLNSFLPTIMKVARLIILLVVLGFVADAWGLFNLAQWIGSEVGARTLGVVVSVSIIIIMAMLVWIALASWIEHRLSSQGDAGGPSAREKTLLALFRNAVAITIIVMTLMIVLAEIGINIGPLIAGAGVLGLAIGFGSQKLVQDIITGVFIQLENAINTGDVVTAGGVTGIAEKLTIRSLGIRDLSGTYHLIPFSSVDAVANYMREFAYHVGEYGVAYREDIDQVIVKLREAYDELITDPAHKANILAELEVHGVTALADSSVNIRVRIKTLPGAQWGVGRAYNRLVKYHLDAAGIEIPFPHLTMYFGQDKNGKAPPAPITIESSPQTPTAQPAPAAQIADAPVEADTKASAKTSARKGRKKGARTNAKTGDDFDDSDDAEIDP